MSCLRSEARSGSWLLTSPKPSATASAERARCQKIAEDLFHSWAKLPEYEPLDEDLAISLVCRIRDALIAEAIAGFRAGSESRDAEIEHWKKVKRTESYRMGYQRGVESTREELTAAQAEIARLREALRRIQGKCGVPDAAEACRLITNYARAVLAESEDK